MSKIYCVEDDRNIRELIEYTLKSAGFDVTGFENGKSFFEAINEAPDLVLLDIMLPDMDGMEILRRIRNEKNTEDLPVILLTAKSERMDKIRGLDSGADDYITKPFDVLELISRVKALLRRSRGAETLRFRELSLVPAKRKVSVAAEEIALTYKEYELLHMLMRAEGRVVPREKIIGEIWGMDFEGESRTLDVHIRTLRQKLGSAGEYIETVRNVGYKIG